jgi:hypothetical protein
MKSSKRRDSGAEKSSTKSSRSKRSRPVPKWLTGSSELDAMARRRCLMILSVLSGERPVTEVIAELEISRGTYYLLETRALNAMLSALVPGAEASSSDTEASSPARRIVDLEAKVKRLEQSKRRGEHMLYLTRQVLGHGPVTQSNRGRPKKSAVAIGSKRAGSTPSPRSKTKTSRSRKTTSSDSMSNTSTPSTPSPMPDGEVAR